MNREQLEFSISQYADGTLPAAETAALETTLANDADARALLEEFRKLDAIVKTTEIPLPAVDWDRFADHLSRAVAEEDRATTSIPIRPRGGAWWVKRVAIAAVVVLAAGVALLWPRHGGHSEIAKVSGPQVPTAPAVAIVQVGGPEIASGAPNVQVSLVEPAAAVQQQANYRIAEDIIYRPPHVVIASGLGDRQDSSSRSSLPY
jgi:anti-sigma-K factor RskA